MTYDTRDLTIHYTDTPTGEEFVYKDTPDGEKTPFGHTPTGEEQHIGNTLNWEKQIFVNTPAGEEHDFESLGTAGYPAVDSASLSLSLGRPVVSHMGSCMHNPCFGRQTDQRQTHVSILQESSSCKGLRGTDSGRFLSAEPPLLPPQKKHGSGDRDGGTCLSCSFCLGTRHTHALKSPRKSQNLHAPVLNGIAPDGERQDFGNTPDGDEHYAATLKVQGVSPSIGITNLDDKILEDHDEHAKKDDFHDTRFKASPNETENLLIKTYDSITISQEIFKN